MSSKDNEIKEFKLFQNTTSQNKEDKKTQNSPAINSLFGNKSETGQNKFGSLFSSVPKNQNPEEKPSEPTSSLFSKPTTSIFGEVQVSGLFAGINNKPEEVSAKPEAEVEIESKVTGPVEDYKYESNFETLFQVFPFF